MDKRDNPVVVGAVRTPFGKFGGMLKDIEVIDLGALALSNVFSKSNIDINDIDEVWWAVGDTSACKDVYTPVIARQTLLKAGLSYSINSITFDKACVSGMSAVNFAISRIIAKEANVVLTGGANTFSTIPYIARDIRHNINKMGNLSLEDPLFRLGYKDYAPVAIDAADVALRLGVTREEQDEFAFSSHKKYEAALNSNFFRSEMIDIEELDAEKYKNIDEQFRIHITLDTLKKLKTIYGSKTCTAGNSPGLNDGSAAQVVTTKAIAEDKNYEVLYEILGITSIATKPNLLSIAPALAIKKCLEKSNILLDEMDIIEINEAFSCVPLCSLRLLSTPEFMNDSYDDISKNPEKYFEYDYNLDLYNDIKSKTNVNGGAVAIGHANTATGARIMMTASYELKRRGGGKAICAICGGLGQGDACIIEA